MATGDKVFTVTAVEDDEPGALKINTEFHQKTDAEQALGTLATVAQGILETMMKFGESIGLTREQVMDVAFGDDTGDSK